MAQDYEATVLLNFDIDEAPAVNSIKDLRQANSQLRAERDKVNISTKEGQELVQKLNTTIDRNNKLIKDNSSALEKQRQNVGNYSKSIQEAAGELNIMGTNVGAVTSKLSGFVNPATAVLGVVTALGAAYARSTIGAKDLAFASSQLSAATTLLTNDFASLISSAEDGEGALSKITNFFISAIGGVGLGAQSKAIALAREAIEDLARDEVRARALVGDRLSDNQELLTQIQDSQTEYNEKISLTGQIIANISKNEDELLAIKRQQLDSAQRISAADSENEDKQRVVLDIEREISNISKDAERRRQAIFRLESNITDEYRKQNEALARQEEIDAQRESDANSNRLSSQRDERVRSGAIGSLTDTNFSPQEALSNREVQTVENNEQLKRNYLQDTAEYEKELFEQRLQATSLYFSAAATLAATAFGEGSAMFKALAIGETIINTYSAATAALAPPPLGAGPILGPALAAVTIATGLANVARITDVGFAEGGYTGRGAKYQPAGIVHKDEYVTPSNIVHSPAAQPHLMALESMRTKGYADGGFVANTNMEATRQAQMFQMMIKNLPPPEVSVVEISRTQRKIASKERVSRTR